MANANIEHESLIPYKQPTDITLQVNPLRSLAYHTVLRCIVCVDCRVVLFSPGNFHNHILNHFRESKLVHASAGSSIDEPIRNELWRYLETLTLANTIERPPPRSIISPYSWLRREVAGWICTLCHDYASELHDTVRKHIATYIGPCNSKYMILKPSADGWKKYAEKCRVQRFGDSTGKYGLRTSFRVYPQVQPDSSSYFKEFLSSMPEYLKNGAPLCPIDSASARAKEFDLPPFLAKTKWTEAVSGYSRKKMVDLVMVPSKDEEIYGRLLPLGRKLLESLPPITQIPHAILNGLTEYKTKKKPFTVLTADETVQAYATEAVRFVAMLLRRRRQCGAVSVTHSVNPTVNLQSSIEPTTSSRRSTSGGTAYAEDDDEEDEDEDADKVGGNTIDDWEEEVWDDLDDDEDGSINSTNILGDGSKEYPILFSKEQQTSLDNLYSLLQQNPPVDDTDLLDKFSDAILQVFISQSTKTASNPYYAPVEVYLISRGIDKNGTFRSSLAMSNTFSKLQYAALFTILRKCIASGDESVSVFNKLKKWLNPTGHNAFASIRTYHRLAYHDALNYVAPPDIRFSSRFGTKFDYKDQRMDVEDFAASIHKTYDEAAKLLSDDLLFGLSDDQLGGKIFSQSVADDTSNSTPGYGILGAERDENWTLMRHMMDLDDLRNGFFDNINDKLKLCRWEATQYLDKVGHFKRLIFFLLHCLAGTMRGTEYIRLKIANVTNRMRNFYSMYDHLAMLGLYNKTSANTGRDNVTLHFLPPALSILIQKFFFFVADVERWIVCEISPEITTDWAIYFFTSHGKRWTSQMLSDALSDQFERTMNRHINLQRFRHIMPAIVAHFGIGMSQVSGVSIPDHQLGHSQDTGDRIYSRTSDCFHHLTHRFCHDSLEFSQQVHQLWGFDSEVPSLERSSSYRKSILDKLSGFTEQQYRDKITSIGSKLDEQQKVNEMLLQTNQEILNELGSLRKLIFSLTNGLEDNTRKNQHQMVPDQEMTSLTEKFALMNSPSKGGRKQKKRRLCRNEIRASVAEGLEELDYDFYGNQDVESSANESFLKPKGNPREAPLNDMLQGQEVADSDGGFWEEQDTQTSKHESSKGKQREVSLDSFNQNDSIPDMLENEESDDHGASSSKPPLDPDVDGGSENSEELFDEEIFHAQAMKRKYSGGTDDDLGDGRVQKPRLGPFKCYECDEEFSTAEKAQTHFNNTNDDEHVKTFKMKFKLNRKNIKDVRYVRQPNLQFQCTCSQDYFQTKKSLLDHLKSLKDPNIIQKHVTALKGVSEKPTW
ncbi:hypothetical protein BDN70DRAFT_937909 [Pholiota conissans]|uniref:Uncharacterized protein n=1 Tax=Pholiota conissans TaxID=109636 RepID=A0A9P5YP64_9AGAR|nr:hypothetical protein BDN70DRAFT_937909 [Pholiota conissans]